MIDNETNEPNIEYVPLKVTAGVLVHIGAGIYNSVAGAIKELVSNSYDADATSVTISMDYPYFNEIKVVDNGVGMSPLRLRQAMQTIGSSLKNLDATQITKERKRPVIGRLGIGLMALSQICRKATIESKEPGASTKLIAELDFSQFKDREEDQMLLAKLEVMKDRYGGLDSMREIIEDPKQDNDFKIEIQTELDIAEMAEKRLAELTSKNPNADLKGEHLGYCVFYPDLPASADDRGTTITLREIDRAVRDQLLDVRRNASALPKKYHDIDKPVERYRDDVNEWGWEDLCQRLQLGTSNFRYSDLPYYHQFLWELASMTPIEYFPDSPVVFEKSILRNKKEELKAYEFSLSVDKHKLTKPIILPSGNLAKDPGTLRKGLDYEIRLINYAGIQNGHPLKYHGYLYWQREQNLPNMIQGLQIYIRNVGIGLYDRTILNYDKVNPGSRIPQTSGEIYVEEGMSQALSVDRSSFRETDTHYSFLKDQVWDLLGNYKDEGNSLFGASVKAYYKRKGLQEGEEHDQHIDNLNRIVSKVSKNENTVVIKDLDSDAPFEIKKNAIIVNDSSDRWPRAAKQRMLYQTIFIPIMVAVERGASAKQILKLLEELLFDSEGEEDATK